jgi:hypothetical protein
MIEAILESGNLSGITFYDNNGQEITAFEGEDGQSVNLEDFDPNQSGDIDLLLQSTAYVIMGRAGQRTMATPE